MFKIEAVLPHTRGLMNVEYQMFNYPDGTKGITIEEGFVNTFASNYDNYKDIIITWKGYKSDEELTTLAFLTRHFQDVFGCDVALRMPYVPNARLDRTKSRKEVFTLKFFCDFINSLNFKYVEIFDPHSNVVTSLLKNVRVRTPEDYIMAAIGSVNYQAGPGHTVYLYFPDDGAAKRYIDLVDETVERHGMRKCPYFIGHKKRNWSDGKIEGLTVSVGRGELGDEDETNFADNPVLMIDDIISYGGTMAYSADELNKLGFKNIYVYATHVENSILDKEKGTLWKRVESGLIKKIYTTDSLLTEPNYMFTVSKL